MAEAKEESKSSEESVKLFVGQVPKHMTESDLLAMFKEFALVDEVNIIKDKATRASRGECVHSLLLLRFRISHSPLPLSQISLFLFFLTSFRRFLRFVQFQ